MMLGGALPISTNLLGNGWGRGLLVDAFAPLV